MITINILIGIRTEYGKIPVRKNPKPIRITSIPRGLPDLLVEGAIHFGDLRRVEELAETHGKTCLNIGDRVLILYSDGAYYGGPITRC